MVLIPASADLPWSPRRTADAAVGEAERGVSQRGGGLSWAMEAWWFDAVAEDGSLAVAVCVGRRPSVGRGWYWAVVAGVGRTTVSVVDPDLTLPASGPPLELRAPGLWADHNPSSPGGHWSVAAEAFGVALDDPWDAWGRGFGDPTPVGFDLEWDPVTPPAVVDGDPGGPAGSWAVGCEVHGEVLVGAERLELTCTGSRGRWWGSAGRPAPGELEISGWSAQGWSYRREDGAFPGEGGVPDVGAPGIEGVVAWAPVLDGAGVDGTPRRLGMAVVSGEGPGGEGPGGEGSAGEGGGSGREGQRRGWIRWCPPGGLGEDDRPPGDARPGGSG